MKLNVDAATSKASQIVAAAAVARDEHGRFLGASAIVISGLSDTEQLEVIACHEGLALASDLGFRKFRFASDCASMVKNIAGACMGDYGQIIMEIKAK